MTWEFVKPFLVVRGHFFIVAVRREGAAWGHLTPDLSQEQNGFVKDSLLLPIEDETEAQELLRELPLSVDPALFVSFIMGFPRRYLLNTPRVEIVKHFLLWRSLGDGDLASSFSPEPAGWILCVIAQDRTHLFSRIAGSLSCFGMNILSAGAFANAHAIALDTFRFTDPSKNFGEREQRRRFQAFLEGAVSGAVDLEEHFRKQADRIGVLDASSIRLTFENDSHPTATKVEVDFPDHFGHLYLISSCISALGAQIEIAYIEIDQERIRDTFYLSRDGKKLTASFEEDLRARLIALGQRYAHEIVESA